VVRLVQPALQRLGYLTLESGRTCVAERTNGDLAALSVATLDVNQDFNVTRSTLAGYHTGDF